MTFGMVSILASIACTVVGWWQARGCRSFSSRCHLAATTLEAEMSTAEALPSQQALAVLPSLTAIERRLHSRQRTAWIGIFFSVTGLQVMVGILVAQVVTPSRRLAPGGV